MSSVDPVGKSHGSRGRRKSTRVAGAVVLLVVAAALAVAGFAIGVSAFLWVAVALAVAAALLVASGRRARKSAPPHADHPHLDHPDSEDTP